MHSQKRHQTQLSPQAQRPQRDVYDNHINQDYFRRSLTNFDLDDSRDSLHTLHKNASVMLPEASDRSSIIDGYPVSPKRVMDKKKMKDVDVKFAEKKEWKKENICSVCQRSVDTGGRSRHHCRLCASTVCGSCSNRKINSRRVCDTCFYKKKLEVQEKQMDEALARMDDTVKETANVLKRTKQEVENEREKCNKLENLIQQEFNMQEASKEKQSKVKYEFLGNLTKAKESQQNLTTNIEKNKTLIAEKESKLRSLKTKIAALNLEVSQKNQKHKDMKDMFEGLLQKHREITDAKNKDSVLGSILGEPGSPHNIVARNYSLLGNDKDGKYNISVQPVKI